MTPMLTSSSKENAVAVIVDRSTCPLGFASINVMDNPFALSLCNTTSLIPRPHESRWLYRYSTSTMFIYNLQGPKD
jgi:hypothetical protein